MLEAWSRDGLSADQIARQKLGIARQTLYGWCRRHEEIEQAILRGREVPDIEVENALHARAVGTKRTREIYVCVPDKETGEVVQRLSQVIVEDVPGDVDAQKFWLQNRKPETWKAKREETRAAEETPRIIIETETGEDYGA